MSNLGFLASVFFIVALLFGLSGAFVCVLSDQPAYKIRVVDKQNLGRTISMYEVWQRWGWFFWKHIYTRSSLESAETEVDALVRKAAKTTYKHRQTFHYNKSGIAIDFEY